MNDSHSYKTENPSHKLTTHIWNNCRPTVRTAEIFCQGFLQTRPEQHTTQLGCGAYRKQRGFWVTQLIATESIGLNRPPEPYNGGYI